MNYEILIMNSDIVLLGSTGSIGEQTLDVARTHKINIRALAARTNVARLEEQAREFKPEAVCIYDKNLYGELKIKLADTKIKVYCGMEGLETLARFKCCVVNAVVGMVGLLPTLAAIEAGNDIALANKETLVAGGKLVIEAALRNNVKIIPIDSEHSAIFQCLMGNEKNKPSKIILTASGGPFYGYNREHLKEVTKEQALSHPNWNMGAKITVDSATLMNKGLEFIEAVWLFGVSPEQIEVVIHRQSVIHSAVEFEDGSIIAQMGTPDMRVPIQFALTYPERYPSPVKRLPLTEIGSLTFEKPDMKVFKLLGAAKEAIKKGGNIPAAMNCANEAAVNAFLQEKIKFHRIEEYVLRVIEETKYIKSPSVDDIFETQKEAERMVWEYINKG